MPHFGLLCLTLNGHLNPMTTLGYELRCRGHRVTLIARLDAQSKALAAGLEFQPFGELKFPAGSAAEFSAKLGTLSGAAAFRHGISLFKQLTLTFLEEVPTIIQRIGTDFLLIDQASSGGSMIAEHLGIPFISVCCALMFNRDINVPPLTTNWAYRDTGWARLRNWLGYKAIDQAVKPITNLMLEYRQKWKLPPVQHDDDPYSDLAQLGQQPAEFEFPRSSLSPCFHFTGPFINMASREPAEFPFDQLTGQPLIYASLGTLQNRLLGAFALIAEACQTLDVQLVIALGGGSSPEDLPPLSGSPLVVRYAPQLELLQKTTLTITHAGLNTTLESLSNGAPMVAIPITHDQPGVAARIAWSGTGEVLALKRLTSNRLRQTIKTVLANPAYKNNALRLQIAIQKAGGVSKAADIVEKVIATGAAVYRQE